MLDFSCVKFTFHGNCLSGWYLWRAVFSSAYAFSLIDHNGKNWIIKRKWNQKLLSPRTVLVCIYGDATAENSVFGFAFASP